jgi:hypothetical protein
LDGLAELGWKRNGAIVPAVAGFNHSCAWLTEGDVVFDESSRINVQGQDILERHAVNGAQCEQLVHARGRFVVLDLG